MKRGLARLRRAGGNPARDHDKLRNAYLAVIRDADITKKLTDAGIDVLQSAAAEFADYLRTETANWAAVIRAANIHAD